MELFSSPSFGILLSIVTFQIGKMIYKRFPYSILNPLLIAMTIVILVLLKFDIPFDSFNVGGKYITFLLGPATVALALPLYRQSKLLKKHIFAIMAGIISGAFTAVISVFIMARMFGLDDKLIVSLLPKSITTPIGMSISSTFNGEVSITILAIAITGTFGAIFSPLVLTLFRIKNKVAKGIAIGTSSHALGTTKAMELGEVEGAMSGLAIGLTGLVTVLIIPYLIKVFF